MMRSSILVLPTVILTALLSACAYVRPAAAQPSIRLPDIPAPETVIGHQVGADYKLARWATILDYFDRLDRTADRINVRRIGIGTEGSPYILAEISTPETLARLDDYKALQAQLADPRRIENDADRTSLLASAKTTIVVTCGLHSSEVAGSQMAMELAYDLASRTDPRTREILDNCVILLVPSANPDGNDKIIDWYEKYRGTPYEGGRMPWLYQKYAGHDDNRDWFMLNLKESRILTTVLYHEWYPTILYDIHQMGNRGPRFFVPPFFDPVNPNVDPLIHQSLLIIGGHMATELQENGKTGVVFKAIYDNWWQGGNRTTPYRHNIVGILTEAASAKLASPIFQEYDDLRGSSRGLPQYAPMVNFPEPWPGGWWRLRDIVEYEKISCYALFTLAARYRDRFVRNHLALSEKAIETGRTEPPFAWLVPTHQRDPGAATHMLNVLILSGIEVHVANESFTADGVEYAPGTHVLLAAQPYRPHLKDMMERQEYPERRLYPGGPAEPPYDSAGWTLPLQMGVRAVEVVSPFTAELRKLDRVDAARPLRDPSAVAYAAARRGNSDYAAVNALLEAGFDAHVLGEPQEDLPIGSIVFLAGDDGDALSRVIADITEQTPARFTALADAPAAETLRPMARPRTALYQPWTASMDEGWTRLVLEQFDFPYTTVHNAEIRAGNLHDRFDCIIIPDLRLSRLLDGISDKDMPPPYAGGLGPDGAIALERFAEDGGTLVLMDSATDLATDLFRIPARNVLKDLPRDEFFCPGSLLRIRVDPSHPLGYGFDDEAVANFVRSKAFVVGKEAFRPPKSAGDERQENPAGRSLSDAELDAKLAARPVTTVARYADNVVLLSGWLLGDDHLRGRTAVAEVGYGKGRIILLGFRVQFRGQPHNTFKFLFNAIYRSTLPAG